jgi:hypothetical protein
MRHSPRVRAEKQRVAGANSVSPLSAVKAPRPATLHHSPAELALKRPALPDAAVIRASAFENDVDAGQRYGGSLVGRAQCPVPRRQRCRVEE